MITSVLNIILCVLMFAAGILLFFRLRDIEGKLEEVLEAFDGIKSVETEDYREYIRDDGNPVIRKARESVTYDRNKLEDNREAYNKTYADYVAYTQMIAIFPLMGILGTVLGLVLQAGSNDISDLVASLGLALYTTLVGLVAAIVLKFYDARFLGRNINLIDAEFARADDVISKQQLRYEIRQAFQKASEGGGDL